MRLCGSHFVDSGSSGDVGCISFSTFTVDEEKMRELIFFLKRDIAVSLLIMFHYFRFFKHLKHCKSK